MAKKTNDDMAGGVSEPKSQAPEVKPAKSLWPKPHTEIRAEPGLEPPHLESGPVSAPEVKPPAGDFETVPAEGYAERPEPVFEAPPEPVAEISEIDASGPESDDYRAPAISQPEQAQERNAQPEREADPFRVNEDERTAAVFDAADHQEPALADPGESKAGRFVAMAAGIVVALALGGVAFVYGASGLGLKFGGGNDTASTAQQPEPAPVAVNAEELKAAQERIAELEARVKAAEEEKAAAEAAKAAAAEQEKTAALPPEPAPSPEPAPAPVPDPSETAKLEPAPPPATASEPKPTAEPARETAAAPAPPPRELAPGPRNLNEQRPSPPATPPRETARAEPEPPPPPRYNLQPSYNEPRSTPEMPVLQGWAVRDVYNGIAVVQSGRGAPMEVEPGDNLPGGNRVLAIRRLGGNWAVVTERGIIAGY